MTYLIRGKVALFIKVVVVTLIASILLLLAQSAFAQREYVISGFLAISVLLLALTYLSKISIPLKFFIPGILLLTAFVIGPILYTVTMSGFNYQKKSKYEISNAGHHLYHIMIYKSDKYGNIYHPDNFVAVLTDPYVYVSHLVQCGFFGLVVKKAKSSTRIVNDVYKKVMKSLNEKG